MLPILTVPHRIFFAYHFYINQVKVNQALVEFYRQKKASIRRERTQRGPKPATKGRSYRKNHWDRRLEWRVLD